MKENIKKVVLIIGITVILGFIIYIISNLLFSYAKLRKENLNKQEEQIYDFGGKHITISLPGEFDITEENKAYFISKYDSYAVINLYSKEELSEGIVIEDFIQTIEDYIYGIYESDEKSLMEVYSNLNKKAYKLSFDSVEENRNIKVNSYLTETENYIIEVHVISELAAAKENEIKYEKMIDSIEEKNNSSEE